MKKDVANFSACCLPCQRVKMEHQRPGGLLQPLPIPVWKWDHITTDFVVGMPQMQKHYDPIWVIVDRLTKSAHFLGMKTIFNAEQLPDLYIKEIVPLHGILLLIVSDGDTKFSSKFWQEFQSTMGTELCPSTTFHSQVDGQSERTIQTLKDMLRACTFEYAGNWDHNLPLVEFAYSNSYHSSVDMAPYEALYRRHCRTPICWEEVGERRKSS